MTPSQFNEYQRQADAIEKHQESLKLQTPVQWLFEKLWNTDKDKLTWQSIYAEALSMERKEIIDAYNEGDCFPQDYHHGAHYYEQTYRKS